MLNQSPDFRYMSLSLMGLFIFGLAVLPLSARQSEVAIKVNGETVKKSELDEEIEKTFKRMKTQYGEQMDDEEWEKRLRKRVREQVIEQTVEELVLKTKAEQSDVSVDHDEVRQRIKAKQDQFGSEEEFEQVLKQQGVSRDEFRQRLESELLVEKFLDQKIGNISVSDKEVKQYYEENKERYQEASFEEMKPSIKRILKQRREQEERKKLVDKLRETSTVKIQV